MPHLFLQVSIWIPIFFVLICLFLLIVPCYEAPYEVGMGVLITVTGIPVYIVCVAQGKRPGWFNYAMGEYAVVCAQFSYTGDAFALITCL